ncbi:MAG: MFS transporter [Bacteroidota bacterium]
MQIAKHILPTIVIAQFCCTSLWFAGNAVMGDLVQAFGLSGSALGHLTSAVQFGFISGTLLFAVLTIADRFSPSYVFFFCALAGALSNYGLTSSWNTPISLLAIRFATGFFLAGIYPVGMKIAADYYDKGLGKSLGFLVGALVLGTAFPHILKGIGASWPWRNVLLFTSLIAAVGGLSMLLFVGDGPNRRPGQALDLAAAFRVFRQPQFRSAAFGYFGHMWELYAFWAFVPVSLVFYQSLHPEVTDLGIPFWSFLIIGAGGLGCVTAGYLSARFGPKRIAAIALAGSGILCLLSPVIFMISQPVVFISVLLLWGFLVVADSPLFSTMVAHNAPAESKGSALTIVNCIGFAITIISIQLLSALQQEWWLSYCFVLLAIGPALGLWALWKKGAATS